MSSAFLRFSAASWSRVQYYTWYRPVGTAAVSFLDAMVERYRAWKFQCFEALHRAKGLCELRQKTQGPHRTLLIAVHGLAMLDGGGVGVPGVVSSPLRWFQSPMMAPLVLRCFLGLKPLPASTGRVLMYPPCELVLGAAAEDGAEFNSRT